MIVLADSGLYPAGFKNSSYISLLLMTPAALAAPDVLGLEYLFLNSASNLFCVSLLAKIILPLNVSATLLFCISLFLISCSVTSFVPVPAIVLKDVF